MLVWMKRLPLQPVSRAALVGILSVVGAAAASRVLAPVSWAATAVEPARARVAGSLIDDLVRRVLPVDLVLPSAMLKSADGGVAESPVAVAITDLRYCGVTDRGVGRFRAVMRIGNSFGEGAMPSTLAGDEGCRKSLNDLARRIATASAGAQEVLVADLDALWRPWELRLVLARTSTPSSPKPGVPQPLGGLSEGVRRDLLTISTSGFRVRTDVGQAITFHVAPSFAPDAIDIAVIVAEDGSAAPAARPAGGGASLVLSGDATAVAELPHAFANQVLRHLTQAEPFPIQVDREVVDVQNASVTGSAGGLTVAAMATPRSIRESVRLTVQAGGADLRVGGVRADAQLESCGGLGTLAAIGCNARNAGRNAAAGAFAATMTRKYQGQLVRELAGPQELRFEIGDRRVDLQGDLLHLASGPRGLSAVARLAPGGQGH